MMKKEKKENNKQWIWPEIRTGSGSFTGITAHETTIFFSLTQIHPCEAVETTGLLIRNTKGSELNHYPKRRDPLIIKY